MLQVQSQKDIILSDYAVTKNEKSLQQLKSLQVRTDSIRKEVKTLIKKNGGDDNDTNYIFLRFVVDYLPVGLVGLLIAIIFLASWGSIAAALNSLASCTVVDFHKRFINKTETAETDYRVAKWYTFGWGVFSIIVAMFAYNIGNSLIEAVNVLGSLFYGTILGIFLVAFYWKSIKGTAVFLSAILVEAIIILLFILSQRGDIGLGFLWLNAIGAIGVVLFAWMFQSVMPHKKENVM
jgi:SSS family solute:Na+ symporter